MSFRSIPVIDRVGNWTVVKPPVRKKRKMKKRTITLPKTPQLTLKYKKVEAPRVRLRREFTGTRGKNFKPDFKLYKPKKFSRIGFVKSTEHRVEKTSNGTNKRAVYVGHGPAVGKILEAFCGAIVVKSFRKQGHKVLSMMDKIQGNLPAGHGATVGTWYLCYKSAGQVQIRVSDTIATDMTYQDVVTQLYDQIVSIDWGGATLPNPQINEFYLYLGVGASSAVNNRVGVVHLHGAQISYEFWSSFKMQNRTPADGGTNTDSMLDIANNPLTGKAYYGNGNGTRPTFTNNTAASASAATEQRMVAGSSNGLIWWNIDDATAGVITSEMDALYKRPPRAAGFAYVKKAVNVTLKPGEIRTSYLKTSKTEFIGKFLRRLSPFMDGTTATSDQCFIGQFCLFGWQKECETPSETSLITLGIEMNQCYKCAIKEKRPNLLHEHQVL